MAINVYTGLMGSGKSYEVVSQVITNAIKQGRRVVTNVDAISDEKVREYVIEKFKVPEEQHANLGHIVHCKNSDVESENFFPFGNPEVETFCNPGDMIAIDEAWRFFGTSKKIPENHQIFFREHRHYVHPETGVSCDLVLMVQDIGDLNRFLKSVVEVSFRTTKLKSVGRPNQYRVESYEGPRQTKKTQITQAFRTYDKKVFPLYSSYVGGKGNELTVDKRGSIFSSKSWIVLPIVGLIAAIVSSYFIYKFFNQGKKPTKDEATQSAIAQQQQPKPVSSEKASTSYRIVGQWTFKEGQYWLVRAQDGSMQAFAKSNSRRVGPLLFIDVDGKPVSFYSGSSGASSGLMGSAPQPMPSPPSTR